MVKMDPKMLGKFGKSIEVITRAYSGYDFDWDDGIYTSGQKVDLIADLVSARNSAFKDLPERMKGDVVKAVNMYVNIMKDVSRDGTC